MVMPIFTIPNQLPIKRYYFSFEVTADFMLPEYSGSLLRGIFGHALRALSCLTKAENCTDCTLTQVCPYAEVFETASTGLGLSKAKNPPQGYIIEPPTQQRLYRKGDIFTFSMVLLGRNIERLPLIAFAWQKALMKDIRGGNASLCDIAVEIGLDQRDSIFKNGEIMAHDLFLQLPTTYSHQYILRFITPLRLQIDGHLAQDDELTAYCFLSQLLRRLSWLSERHLGDYMQLHYSGLAEEIAVVRDHKMLYWQDWARYSTRQKRKMHLGGMLGTWDFNNLSQDLAKLLYLGQWLHAGKNTTFGLGRYELLQRI